MKFSSGRSWHSILAEVRPRCAAGEGVVLGDYHGHAAGRRHPDRLQIDSDRLRHAIGRSCAADGVTTRHRPRAYRDVRIGEHLMSRRGPPGGHADKVEKSFRITGCRTNVAIHLEGNQSKQRPSCGGMGQPNERDRVHACTLAGPGDTGGCSAPCLGSLVPHWRARFRIRRGVERERCMKAAQFSRFGGPEVLEIVDLPEPHACYG